MNAILEQINLAGLRFVEFALPMFVQSVVLIFILLLADFALRKKVRAVFRYWIWLLVLLKLVLPTSLSSPLSLGYFFGDRLTYVDRAETPPVPQANVVEPSPVSVPPFIDLSNIEADRFTPAAPPIIPVTDPAVTKLAAPPVILVTPLSWQGAVFLTWLTVVMAMLLLLLQRAIFVRGLVAQAKEANGFMADTLESCRVSMSVKRKLSFKISANATSPAVCGLFSPAILVPQNLASSLTAGQLKAVLLHELAHIRRGDLFVNLAQTILQIIYFYNPLLWLANCIIRRIREQAVDEMVLVAMGEKAPQYPQTLVSVAKLAFHRPVLSLRLIGVVESKSALSTRIKHILNRPMPKKAKLGIIGLLVVIIIGAILLPMANSMSGPPKLVIKGVVKDALTGEPIAGARVFDDGYGPEPVWEQIRPDVRCQWGAITNEAGQYSFLTWPEHHTIKVQAPGFKALRRSLYSGHFTFNKKDQEIFDFTLESEKVSDSSEFKKTLPNGVTVELIGVCEHPSEGKQWWRPDGGMLSSDQVPSEYSRMTVEPDETEQARELALRFSGPGVEHMSFRWKIVKASRSSSHPFYMTEKREKLKPQRNIVFKLPCDIETLDFNAGVAVGEWKKVASGGDGTTIIGTNDSLTDSSVIFHEAIKEKDILKLSATHLLGDAYDCRIMVVDRGDKLHEPSRSSNSGDDMRLCRGFFDVTPEQIKYILLQARPYQLVEFKNISLKPNFKTDVRVKVGKAKPETEVYIFTFKPIASFRPVSARKLLEAFNENHPDRVRTHHFHTEVKGKQLIGHICVDTESGRDAVINMLKQSDKLNLVSYRTGTPDALEKLYKMGQPGHKTDAQVEGEEAWGEVVEGLRVRWVHPNEPIVRGTAPVLTMEVENVSSKQIIWECSSGFTWGLNVHGVSPANSLTMPKFRVQVGSDASPEYPGGKTGPEPQPTDYYKLEPEGRIRLSCALPWVLPDSGQYTVNGVVWRRQSKTEGLEMGCSSLVLNVVNPTSASDKLAYWGAADTLTGLQLGLSFDLQARPYRQGEVISFKAHVRNTGDKIIKLVYFGLLGWGPTIFDSNGEIVSVWTPILGFPVQKQSLSLNPGEIQSVGSVFLELKPRPDTRWDGKSVYPRCYLTPGTYRISQKYRFADYPEANWHGELTTGELELTILRKPPDAKDESETDWVIEDYGQTRLLSDKEKPDTANWVSIWASAVKNKGRYLVPDRGLTLKELIKAAGYNRDKLALSYVELSRRSRQGNITACSTYSRNLKTLLSGKESDIVLKSHDSVLGGYIEPSANGVEFWSGYHFGEVVELTVNDDGAKVNMFADLDAGKLVTPPDILNFDDENAVLRWIKDNGIDVMGETAAGVNGLAGFNMYAARVDNYFWDAGPREVTDRLMVRIDDPVLLSVESLLPVTYLIKTSEYKLGILQILGFVENPKGIKIRYKLLNKEVAPKPDLQLGAKSSRTIQAVPLNTFEFKLFEKLLELVRKVERQYPDQADHWPSGAGFYHVDAQGNVTVWNYRALWRRDKDCAPNEVGWGSSRLVNAVGMFYLPDGTPLQSRWSERGGGMKDIRVKIDRTVGQDERVPLVHRHRLPSDCDMFSRDGLEKKILLISSRRVPLAIIVHVDRPMRLSGWWLGNVESDVQHFNDYDQLLVTGPPGNIDTPMLVTIELPKGMLADQQSDLQVETKPVSGDWQYIGQSIPPDFNDTMILAEHINLGSIGHDAERKTFITFIRDGQEAQNSQYRFVLFTKDGKILEPDGHIVLGENKRLEEKFTFDEPFITRQLKGFRFQSRSLPSSGIDNISSQLQKST
ncbi:MAG: M48 family metalloprotease, partial [Planctomycetes bacterium]|nr:M48 family metalloprotease [Planctomycetota bacterium]